MGSSVQRGVWIVGACAALTSSCGGKSASDPAPVSACAEVPSYPAAYGAGARLKPMVYDAGCGAEQHSGYWYDGALDEQCAFMVTEDGVERCVPPWVLAENGYADANCTLPVTGRAECSAPPPRFAVDWSEDSASCPGGKRVYRVTEPLPKDAPVFEGSPGACAARGQTLGFAFYALERVAPETFVSGRRSQRERTSLLAAETLEAEDGAWNITGFFDPVRASRCEGSDSWEPRGRCIPPHTMPPSPPDRFSDPECKVGVAFGNPCRESPRIWFEHRDFDSGCQPQDYYDLYEVDGPAETTYVRSLAQCSVGGGPTIPPDAISLRRGAPIDPQSLPAVETLSIGSGRVQARFWAAEGVPFFPIGFSEAETGSECYLRPFADGVTRCVPRSWPLGSYAPNSDCTGIVAGVRGCEAELPGILAEQRLACSSVISGAFSATLYDGAVYDPNGGVCAPFPRSTLGNQAKYFRAGAKLNAAQLFGEVKLVVRD